MIAAMLHVLTVSQQNSFALLQANTMDRQMFGSFRIPAASMTVFSMLAIMICLPIYDKVVLPFARRVTGTERGITFLQRIGIGNAMNVSAMVLAGLVENQRRAVARQHGLLDKPNVKYPSRADVGLLVSTPVVLDGDRGGIQWSRTNRVFLRPSSSGNEEHSWLH
ncbi:hypothetical protein L7F22_002314 [Adiantum nelumboides]|nr:hypothetical protein [Adiantum nelumboides]